MTDRLPHIASHARGVPKRYKSSYERASSGVAPPMKAIAAKCMDCGGYQRVEAVRCTVYACPLWAYRPGSGMKRRAGRVASPGPPNKGSSGAQD